MKRSNRPIVDTTPDFAMALLGDNSHGDFTLNILWDTFAADGQRSAFLELPSSNEGQTQDLSQSLRGNMPQRIMPAQIEEAWMGWSARPGLSPPLN
jgi:hypothetical protein